MKNRKNIGVIVIGDHVQALGIIRSLGRRGIPVYLLHDKHLFSASADFPATQSNL